ncbi:hypothetical protein [Allosphingosinicella sp.]|uniref:hypothetical protein n=1 Tax=Allosphingosinicella sp. TaxID=2823234 RepID=UPI0037831307
MARSLARPILIGTLIAGTLDILAAITLTLFYGKRSVGEMLSGVASGPFPGAETWGTGGAVAGLAVHYTLMAIMVTVFVLAATRLRRLWQQPILWGVLYGLATYVVMNLIVMPLRFGTPVPPPTRAIVTQLFCHIVLVGIPIALVTARHFRGRSPFR